jgi:Tetratricopeptide repeat.
MKKLFIIAFLLSALPAVAQDKVLVSQSIADAINSGKFYMKLAGSFSDINGAENIHMKMDMEIAYKDGVSMNRVDANGFNSVMLQSDGYSYTLNEKTKTYSGQKIPDDEGDISLRFIRQGTCKLNGQPYHYDQWQTPRGHKFTFYYNSNRVSAIEMEGLEQGEDMPGLLYLLSFDIKIPSNMYFCLDSSWKQGAGNGQQRIGGTDMSGIGMSDADLEKLIRSQVKESDLPAGMTIENIIAMSKGQMAGGMAGMGGVSGAQAKAPAVPRPPMCSKPWIDISASCELAASGTANTGALSFTGKQPSQRGDYVYMADFEEAPAGPRLDLNVTDAGVLLAFERMMKATEGMTRQEQVRYVNGVSSDALTSSEVGAATGEMVEEAIAACAIAPSSLTYNNAGMMLVYVSDLQRALDYYNQALSIDPDNPAILTNIADLYFGDGNLTKTMSYTDRALAAAPCYGPALQMRTSILLAQGKTEEAIPALFTTAQYYFSDITAAQFFSLWLYLESVSARISATSGSDYPAEMGRLMSAVNLELLKKATMAGFNKHPATGTPEHRQFEYPFETASVRLSHESLGAIYESLSQQDKDALEKKSALTKNHHPYVIYWAMGLGNATPSFTALDNELEKVPGYPVEDYLTSIMPTGFAEQSYEGVCGTYGYNGGVNFNDARQFWCFMIWNKYYELQLKYASGGIVDLSKGLGSCPEVVKKAYDIKQYWNKEGSKLQKDWEDCKLEAVGHASSELDLLKGVLRCNRAYYSAYIVASNMEELGAEKINYTTNIQPVIQEYWAKATELAGYCNDPVIRDAFMLEVEHNVLEAMESPYYTGADCGEDIDFFYQNEIVTLQKMIGEKVVEEQRKCEEEQEKLKTPGASLKSYGQKDTPDFGAGINTPFGRVAIDYSGGEWSFSATNNATGKTDVFNLTTGATTSQTTYTTLADEAKAGSPIWNNIGEAAKEKTIDFLGEATLQISDLSKFKVGTSGDVSRQRARTTDRMGNVVDTQDVVTRSRSFSGGGVTATASETQIRSGNAIQTKHHLNVSFGNFDFTIGK